ncbi:hypothetical protein SAMN06309944_0709 [Micrococcales bacterium KH10]|nr:hypothetical protein SAMN06309944_0709 [Micrococcales bacterium KH10]
MRPRTRPNRRRILAYRNGYLKSEPWWTRRAAYCADRVRELGHELACMCCGGRITARTAHIHHLSYRAVTRDMDGNWVAGEADNDLLEMCATCHITLHRIFTTNASMRTKGRRGATIAAIRIIRRTLHINNKDNHE